MTGFVVGSGPAGNCDDYRVGGAAVDREPDGGLWRMWYYCRDAAFDRPAPMTLGTGRIALATSHDGIAWSRFRGGEEHGAVMIPAADPAQFDCAHLGVSDVRRTRDGWRLWYFGGDRAIIDTGLPTLGAVPGLAMRCGTARSSDGLSWQREPGATPSGALFDVSDDEMYAAWPNVVPITGRTLVQYTAPSRDLSDYRTRVVAVAPSGAVERLGPLRWSSPSAPHDVGGIVTRHVIAHPRGAGWLMAYTALTLDHRRSIALAESDDGLVWHRQAEPVLVAGSDGAWDDFGVAVNSCVVADDRLFLYYYGFRSLVAPAAARGIGLAIADLSANWQFERVLGTKHSYN